MCISRKTVKDLQEELGAEVNKEILRCGLCGQGLHA